MGIVFALISGFIQALGYIVLKRSFRDFPPSVSFYLRTIIGLFIWIPYGFLTGINLDGFVITFLFALLSAFFSEALVNYALSKGQISIASAVFSTYPVFTILFSNIFLGEVLVGLPLVLIAIIIISLIAISFKGLDTKKSDLILIGWPLLAAIAVGISDSLSKGVISNTSSGTFLVALAIAQVPISLIFLKLENQKVPRLITIKNNLNTYRFALIAAFTQVIQLIFFWLAFELNLASIASPLTGTYVIFVLIMARVFLKEEVSEKDAILSILIVISIVVLGFVA